MTIKHLLLAGLSASFLLAQTPDQVKNRATADAQTTLKIRRDLSLNRALSPQARKISVVTHSGKVTLQGAVRSDEEKKAVESIAQKDAGVTNVVSQITVPAYQ